MQRWTKIFFILLLCAFMLNLASTQEESRSLSKLAFPKKLLNFLFRPLSHFSLKRKSEKVAKPSHALKADSCEGRGGHRVNGECYEVLPVWEGRKTFYDARISCISRGGDLWTPDVFDPFLLNKLMKEMPSLFARSFTSVWIGVHNFDGQMTTIHGDDVTTAPLLTIGNNNILSSKGKCTVLSYDEGAIFGQRESCSKKIVFICEYPMKNWSTER